MVSEYIKSFDHSLGAWSKKGEATSFGDFLAHELGISRRGVVWDKDGNNHRLHIPLVAQYWHPNNAEDWQRHLEELQYKVKKWASA